MPKLVIVKVPTSKARRKNQSEKDTPDTEDGLDNEIGDVLEGLTELAQRFPDDFTSLLEAFEGAEVEQEEHKSVTRNIQQSEVSIVKNLLSAGDEKAALCTKPPSPPNGQVLCNALSLSPGSLCLLQCSQGWVPRGKELTRCTQAGTWTEGSLLCVRPVAMLVGGYNVEEDLLSDVELYSPSGKCQGVRVADLPQARRGLVTAWVGGKVLACGGVNGTLGLNLCWQYNPETNSWSETAPQHNERHFGSVVAASGSLVVLGGRDGTPEPMARGDIEQFQVEDWTWTPVKTKMTLERSYQCAVGLARDKLLVTGGYSWNSILARTETLNMTAGPDTRWSRLAPLGTPRYLHSCAPLVLQPGGEVGVIVSGGYSSTYLNSTEIYIPSRDRWEAGGDMAVPRQGAAILVLEGKPTVLGGFHDYDKYPTLAEQYDHNLGFWFPLKIPLKKGRRYFGAVAVPETLFPQCH